MTFSCLTKNVDETLIKLMKRMKISHFFLIKVTFIQEMKIKM
jgi:hypothetical protein